MKEAQFQDLFQAELRKWGCYVPSQAASMFMSGQPDLMIYNTVGNSFPAELKVWVNKNPPVSHHSMVGLLRGPQINVITKQLWSRNIYCPIIALDQVYSDYCYHSYRTLEILRFKWKDLAKEYATRRQTFITTEDDHA